MKQATFGSRRWRVPALLAVTALTLLAASASAESRPDPASDPSAPGAYCAIGQCRPVRASAWTPAAFALTVLVIGRGARRGALRH